MASTSGTTAFDRLAGAYAQARPDYPAALVAATAAAVDGVAVGDGGERVMVDVGAGTGISTRAIAGALRRPTRVLGVEPGEGMRREAQRRTDAQISYVVGEAERLPLGAAGAVGVQVAQAIHWFDRSAFYGEVKRVLVPGGVLAIMQNNRACERSPLIDAYETLLERHSPGYVRTYRVFDIPAELAASGGFGPCERIVVPWERSMTAAQFVMMTRSSSRFDAVVARYGAEQAERMVRELLGDATELTVAYDAELFLARVA